MKLIYSIFFIFLIESGITRPLANMFIPQKK